VTGGDVYGMTV